MCAYMYVIECVHAIMRAKTMRRNIKYQLISDIKKTILSTHIYIYIKHIDFPHYDGITILPDCFNLQQIVNSHHCTVVDANGIGSLRTVKKRGRVTSTQNGMVH